MKKDLEKVNGLDNSLKIAEHILFGIYYACYWNPYIKEMVITREWRVMDGEDTQPEFEVVASFTSLRQFNNSIFS